MLLVVLCLSNNIPTVNGRRLAKDKIEKEKKKTIGEREGESGLKGNWVSSLNWIDAARILESHEQTCCLRLTAAQSAVIFDTQQYRSKW